MSETIEVRLARLEETSRQYLTRIEDMLKAHFGRIDDRCSNAAEKIGLHGTRLNRHSERLDKLEKAVRLSEERYCGISATYRKAMGITSEIRILEY